MELTKPNECEVQCDHSGCLSAPRKMLNIHKSEAVYNQNKGHKLHVGTYCGSHFSTIYIWVAVWV